MQQPLRQRLKLPIIYYGLITWFSLCLWVCFFWYLIFLVENWQNLVLSLLLAHHQCWAYCCVCLNMGCKSRFCKTTCRTSFFRNFMSFMYLLFWLVTKIWSEKKVHFYCLFFLPVPFTFKTFVSLFFFNLNFVWNFWKISPQFTKRKLLND